MSILKKEELLSKIKDKIGDGEETIEILEDIDDTFNDYEERLDEDWKSKYESNNEEWQEKYDNLEAEWRQRYADRFYSQPTLENAKKEQKKDVVRDGEKVSFKDLFISREG